MSQLSLLLSIYCSLATSQIAVIYARARSIEVACIVNEIHIGENDQIIMQVRQCTLFCRACGKLIYS